MAEKCVDCSHDDRHDQIIGCTYSREEVLPRNHPDVVAVGGLLTGYLICCECDMRTARPLDWPLRLRRR